MIIFSNCFWKNNPNVPNHQPPTNEQLLAVNIGDSLLNKGFPPSKTGSCTALTLICGAQMHRKIMSSTCAVSTRPKSLSQLANGTCSAHADASSGGMVSWLKCTTTSAPLIFARDMELIPRITQGNKTSKIDISTRKAVFEIFWPLVRKSTAQNLGVRRGGPQKLLKSCGAKLVFESLQTVLSLEK